MTYYHHFKNCISLTISIFISKLQVWHCECCKHKKDIYFGFPVREKEAFWNYICSQRSWMFCPSDLLRGFFSCNIFILLGGFLFGVLFQYDIIFKAGQGKMEMSSFIGTFPQRDDCSPVKIRHSHKSHPADKNMCLSYPELWRWPTHLLVFANLTSLHCNSNKCSLIFLSHLIAYILRSRRVCIFFIGLQTCPYGNASA